MAAQEVDVARMFPARRQPDGTIWYRSGKSDQDGWSSNPEYGHPSYFAADAPEPLDCPANPWITNAELDGKDPVVTWPAKPTTTTTPEETTMTALTEDFELAPRATEWMNYPLPPEPPRAKIRHGAYGWYQLPSPTTGRPTGFPRATTIADTLDDQYGLNKWKRRETAMRIHQLATMDPSTKLSEFYDTTAAEALDALVTAMGGTKVTEVDTVLDVIDNLLGGAEARELGECVHAWLEALCLGMVLYHQVPAIVRPHIDAALKVMAHRGIISRPEYIERVILNEQGDEVVAGRIDCIWELATTGELVLGDWKTNKDLKYSWLSYGVQIGGCYGWATKMLTTDGKGWEPMPKLRGIPHADDHKPDCPIREHEALFADETCPRCGASADQRSAFAILLHVPSNTPEQAAAITIDMTWGGEMMAESLLVRSKRKEAKTAVPQHAIPAPSDEALRIVAARIALSKIASLEEGQAVYETYQDVWNDDLGEFAQNIAELF